MHLLRHISRILAYGIDTIAPPDPLIREIEGMSLGDFALRAETESPGKRSDGIISLFPYRTDVVRASLVELKTFRNRKIERLLGRLVHERLAERLYELDVLEGFNNPLLVPVAMTKRSLRGRGWNQCELVAREIILADRGTMLEKGFDALTKTRHTGDQVGRTRAERLEGLKDSFTARGDGDGGVGGRNVIVLDDIVTTGATLGEAKRALLQAGARAVICLAVAS
ncbi:MAG: phosphoribosyltransferase family protein [Candidatus Paceibacterota bacterium]|jgi:predicted amidophosphoribosyltransferase